MGRNKMEALVAILADEVSHDETRSQLQHMVDQLDRGPLIHFVDEVFDDYFIYAARGQEDQPARFYRQNYGTTGSGAMTLEGDPVEVERQTTWRPV